MDNDRGKEDTLQTMRELMEGVNQRDSDIEKLEMQIDDKDLVVCTHTHKHTHTQIHLHFSLHTLRL